LTIFDNDLHPYYSDINDLLAMKFMDQTLDLRGGKTPQAKAKASETSPCPQENQAKNGSLTLLDVILHNSSFAMTSMK